MTSTELGYLSGVTSNIQDQLNGKVNYKNAINLIGDCNNKADLPRYASAFRTTSGTLDGSVPYAWTSYVRIRSGYNGSYDMWLGCNENLIYCMTADGGIPSASNWKRCLTSALNSADYGDSLPGYNDVIGQIFFLKST